MASTSEYDKIHSAIVSDIIALSLTSTDRGNIGNRVYKQPVSTERAVTFPCVLVILEAPNETEGDGSTFENLDTIYSATVLILDRADVRDLKDYPASTWLAWREKIATWFRQGPIVGTLASVPSVWNTEVTFGVQVDPKDPEYQHAKSGLTVHVWASVSRNRA